MRQYFAGQAINSFPKVSSSSGLSILIVQFIHLGSKNFQLLLLWIRDFPQIIFSHWHKVPRNSCSKNWLHKHNRCIHLMSLFLSRHSWEEANIKRFYYWKIPTVLIYKLRMALILLHMLLIVDRTWFSCNSFTSTNLSSYTTGKLLYKI